MGALERLLRSRSSVLLECFVSTMRYDFLVQEERPQCSVGFISGEVERPVWGGDEIGETVTGLTKVRERERTAGAEHQIALIIQFITQFGEVGISFAHHDAVQATAAVNGRPSVTLCAECRHSRPRDSTKRPGH